MLTLDPDCLAALEDNHQPGYQITAFYGAELTYSDVPVTFDGSVSFSGTAAVQGTASLYVSKNGPDSLVPQAPTDVLAPFGQELQIDRTVTKGSQTWNIPLGRFRIANVPSARDYFQRYPAMLARVGWEVKLDLNDRFDMIQADDFTGTSAPVPGNSTWDEIARVSPIPVVRSLPDLPLPTGLVYQSIPDAINQLATHLGGHPHMTRQGALTVRVADAWLTATTPVATINGVLTVDDGMSNSIYNSVVCTTNQNAALLSVAELTDPTDPLSTASPLGRRVYKYQDPLATTQAQLDATAATVLARMSKRQSQIATVQCLPRPDLELGDYVSAIDTNTGRTVTGEVDSMSFPMDPTAFMTLTLIVSEYT